MAIEAAAVMMAVEADMTAEEVQLMFDCLLLLLS